MKRSEFPDWVINALPPGCIVKQQGEHYYVYKRTSQRVKGMKYPQPKDVYVGRISEDRGFVQKEKILVEYSNVETYELGMSYAIIHCCP
ncbi:MAG: hypothetical protein IJ708_07495, partial [Clostridia bacterium]|nr:hypothetical protein [Clostridia bacterium]